MRRHPIWDARQLPLQLGRGARQLCRYRGGRASMAKGARRQAGQSAGRAAARIGLETTADASAAPRLSELRREPRIFGVVELPRQRANLQWAQPCAAAQQTADLLGQGRRAAQRNDLSGLILPDRFQNVRRVPWRISSRPQSRAQRHDMWRELNGFGTIYAEILRALV
jgi:hypothetical protein